MGLISIIGVGLTTGSFWAFGGIFATRSGMDSDGAALFLTVAIMGAALFQWPIGRASDNIDRRFVMVVLNIFAVLVCVTVSLFSPDQPGLILLAGFLFGAVVFPTYALAVAHTFDHAEADQHVTIASVYFWRLPWAQPSGRWRPLLPSINWAVRGFLPTPHWFKP